MKNDLNLLNVDIAVSRHSVSFKKDGAYEAIAVKTDDTWTLCLRKPNYAYDINDIVEDACMIFKQHVADDVSFVKIDRAKFCMNDFICKFDLIGYTSPKLLVWDRSVHRYDLKEIECGMQYDNARYVHDCGDIILKIKNKTLEHLQRSCK